MGWTEERNLTRRGVQVQHLLYSSDDLRALRGQAVVVKLDPRDLGQVWVRDPREGHRRFIAVPANHPGYAAGLSLWQHRVICRRPMPMLTEMTSPCWWTPKPGSRSSSSASGARRGRRAVDSALLRALVQSLGQRPTSVLTMRNAQHRNRPLRFRRIGCKQASNCIPTGRRSPMTGDQAFAVCGSGRWRPAFERPFRTVLAEGYAGTCAGVAPVVLGRARARERSERGRELRELSKGAPA